MSQSLRHGGRVVFVNRFFFPDEAATSQLLSDLAFAAAESGREVLVVTSSQRYRGEDRLPPAETIRGVEVKRLWTPGRGRASLARRAMQYVAFYLGAGWYLLRRLRRGDIVVVLTDPPALSVPAAIAASIKGAMLVNWIQDIFPEVAARLGVAVPGQRLIARARNWSLRRAHANVVLSPGMSRIIAGAGADPDRIRLIENWTDEEAIQPLEAHAARLRSEWALADRFVVEYSGNMGRVHEFGTVLGAAERLADEPGIVFLLIGEGHALASIRARVADLALPNVVIKPPQPRERLADVLAVGDVHLVSLQPAMEGLVVPSKYYGVLAAGRPVLYVGDRDGDLAREILRCDCGRVAAPGDAIELAGQIRSLRSDAAECRRLGARARQLSETRYTRRAALQRWEQLLSELAAGPVSLGHAAEVLALSCGMTNAILKYLIAFVVTAVTVKALSRPAIRIGLVDRPGGRKRHDVPVPLIGGPAMFAGFVFGALMLMESLYLYRVLFVSMALLVVVGALDDARDLKPSSKSVAQLVAALFMTSWAGLFVTQLGNLFGFVVLDLRNWAIPFTVVCVLGVINAINMTDGLDGLAGGLVLVALSFLCAGAVDAGNLGAAKLLALMAAAVAGFLLFNMRLPWQPRARAFMGDSGSMMLGFVLVWFCVELTQVSSPRLEPMSVVWFLAVPLLDMGFVILRRVLKGRSPFAADRSHLHHVLLAAGFTPGQVTWILIAFATVFAAFGWAGWRQGWPGYVMFYAFVAVFVAMALIGRRAWRLVRLVKRLRAGRRAA